jgi:hypothetical protein
VNHGALRNSEERRWRGYFRKTRSLAVTLTSLREYPIATASAHGDGGMSMTAHLHLSTLPVRSQLNTGSGITSFSIL